MARGRFVSESIAKDTRLNSLSIEAQLLYLMAIPHLDRDGLIDGDPDVLWATICPKRRVFIDAMASFIQEWIAAKLVICYECDEGLVLWFCGFVKNQNGLRYDRESPSRFPPPPSGAMPDECRTNSGVSPAQWQVQDQVKDQDQEEEGDRARMTEPPQPPPTPPPSYRTIPSPNEYIPGVRRPQQNQAKRNCDQFMTRATAHSVGPEPFRLMVDAVLDATGKTSLANTSGDAGQATLNQAKETVVTLLEMGRKALEDVQAVLLSWGENDWRGTSPPTFGQIVEHASAMDAGTHVTKRRQDNGKKEFTSYQDYNEWARRYDPECKRIKEGITIKGLLIKRPDYRLQPTH